MNKLLLPDYNLWITLLGGQAFNFDFINEENLFYGFTQDKILKLKLKNKTLFWQTYPKIDDLHFIKNYLRLDENYKNVLKNISKDKYIKLAIKRNPNLRLLKQDFDQTLLSYIISSNNNIKAIRRIIRSLNIKFGQKIKVDDKTFYLFPSTESLAKASLEDLLECKLGFRAKFLKSAANIILENNLKNKIKKMNECETRESLLSIPGIGNKITDCIMVFSLCYDNISPIDVWGKRFLIKFYNLKKTYKYENMRMWLSDYFGEYTSWAGQFLFEYIRSIDDYSQSC